MSLRHLDIEQVMRRLADKRVEDAMAEGKFDNLPGKGEPIVIEETPTDEKSKALWWAIKLLKQNDFIPDEVRYRKLIDQLKSELAAASDLVRVTALCRQINHFVHKLNTMGTTAINTGVSGVDEAEELRKRSGA
jgi:hypothetical protein